MTGSRGSLDTFSASLEASISVVLVLFYGYAARMYNYITEGGEKNIASLGVNIFLPALLLTEVGPNMSADNLFEYWPIVLFSVIFFAFSSLLGYIGVELLGLPQYVLPSCGM